jgi:hypothetical protein
LVLVVLISSPQAHGERGQTPALPPYLNPSSLVQNSCEIAYICKMVNWLLFKESKHVLRNTYHSFIHI